MVDDDLFISKTYDNWYFGGDNSGNVMNRHNILDLKKKIASSHVGDMFLLINSFLEKFLKLFDCFEWNQNGNWIHIHNDKNGNF